MENVIIVPSGFDSEKILIGEQKIWSAVEIADNKITDLEYLVIYRKQDTNYPIHLQGTLFGLFRILGYVKIDERIPKTNFINNHQNFNKYILFLEETNIKFYKKSPRIYQSRDYMSYQDFISLSNI